MTETPRIEPQFGQTPPPLPTPATSTRYRPRFNGSAGEFFGIWIVNVLLSVVTLGIYSAWAKVRTQRYFYANTTLVDSSFEYLADPIRILKGRLVAYAFLVTLGVSARLEAYWVVIPLYLFVLALFPALIWLGLRFRARYSAWRGLRFRFDAPVSGSYGVFMGLPLLSLFTLNLLIPWVHIKQQDYMVQGHSFGGTRFDFRAASGDYFTPFFIALGASVAGGIGFFVTITLFAGAKESSPGALGVVGMLLVLVFYAGLFAVSIYLRTAWTNLLWNNTRLGEHRFESTLKPLDMIGLYFTNALAILCTVGLAVPWARVRMMRYRVEQLSVLTRGSLDNFVGQADEAQSAVGAEISHALDLDLDVAL